MQGKILDTRISIAYHTAGPYFRINLYFALQEDPLDLSTLGAPPYFCISMYFALLEDPFELPTLRNITGRAAGNSAIPAIGRTSGCARAAAQAKAPEPAATIIEVDLEGSPSPSWQFISERSFKGYSTVS